MLGISELSLAQRDGGLPTTLVAGSAVGESGSPFSAFGSVATCISARQRNSISSGLRRRCGLTAASLVELFGTRPRQGRWRSVLLASTAVPMPKKASMPSSSQSIQASWHSPPQRVRHSKRS
jgi:hypothetical protein